MVDKKDNLLSIATEDSDAEVYILALFTEKTNEVSPEDEDVLKLIFSHRKKRSLIEMFLAVVSLRQNLKRNNNFTPWFKRGHVDSIAESNSKEDLAKAIRAFINELDEYIESRVSDEKKAKLRLV